MTNRVATTFTEYLESHDVELVACTPTESAHPRAAIPTPDGWLTVPADVLPQAYAAIVAPEYTERAWAPNAVLLHSRLSKWRPTGELLEIAGTEARNLPEWNECSCDTSDFQGHRSVVVHGSYRIDGIAYTATTRYVVIDHEYDRYLTQLTVTIPAGASESLRADVRGIHEGFTVNRLAEQRSR